MSRLESDEPPGSEFSAGKTRALANLGKQTAELALQEARRLAVDLHGLRADVSEIKEALGAAPSPALGRQGSGLIGAVSDLQTTLDRLVRAEEARAKAAAGARARKKVMPTVIALIATLGGGGGIATVVHSMRGAPPAAQTSGAPPAP